MSRHKELFNLMHMLDLDEIPYWFDACYTKINKIMKNGKIL